MSAGYTLAKNKKSITYSSQEDPTVLATIKGVKKNSSKDKFSLNTKTNTITAKKAALSSNITVSGSKYGFSFGTDYTDATISGSAKKDTISVAGDYISLNSGAGDDVIKNSGSNVTLNAGTGDDSISISGSRVSIDGGDGNDTIRNSGKNVTLSGGKGNDILYGKAGYAATVTTKFIIIPKTKISFALQKIPRLKPIRRAATIMSSQSPTAIPATISRLSAARTNAFTSSTLTATIFGIPILRPTPSK